MDLIAYGKVIKPHGLSGEVKVLPFSGEFSSFKNFKNLYISQETEYNYVDGLWRPAMTAQTHGCPLGTNDLSQ